MHRAAPDIDADLHLNTLYVLDGDGRIISTREPGATCGPLFALVRSETCCVCAVRVDIPTDTANELVALATGAAHLGFSEYSTALRLLHVDPGKSNLVRATYGHNP